jgi:hypothetical protein
VGILLVYPTITFHNEHSKITGKIIYFNRAIKRQRIGDISRGPMHDAEKIVGPIEPQDATAARGSTVNP